MEENEALKQQLAAKERTEQSRRRINESLAEAKGYLAMDAKALESKLVDDLERKVRAQQVSLNDTNKAFSKSERNSGNYKKNPSPS